MASTKKSVSPRVLTTGVASILIGILLTVVVADGRDGFDKGLAQGAGIALMLMGVFLLSTATMSRSWLPSRDSSDG